MGYGRTVRMGQRIRARDQRELVELLRSLGITVAPPLVIVPHRDGAVITIDEEYRPMVRITSVGTGTQAGSYGWQRILGGPGGSWVDAPGSGTLALDPLYEANGYAGLAVGDRVEAVREVGSGEMRTQMEHC